MMAKITDTQKKHWIFFCLMILGAILVFMGVFFLIWTDMSLEEKKLGARLLDRVFIYSALAIVVGFLISSQFIKYIFRNYITPIEKLTEETRLIAVANSKYRIQPEGALETHKLTSVINELADAYLSLKMDVRSIIEKSQIEQEEEKKRLEALMSQIPQGVIVCNFDGRILLFNHKAHHILTQFEAPEAEIVTTEKGVLGLGRSIFGLLYRPPLIHALNYLQNKLNQGFTTPLFDFITTRFGKQFLQINMAPILNTDTDQREITGYILTISDITIETNKKSQRDIFLQTLTLKLQEELSKIQKNNQALYGHPELPKQALTQSKSIDESVLDLLKTIDQVALQHKNRLNEPENKEHILGNELIDIIKEDISTQFKLPVSTEHNNDIWLNISSYSIIRGVMYLLGQLTQNITIGRVYLSLIREKEVLYLTVKWEGGEIEINTIEEWKKCPLMTRAKNQNTYSLESLVVPEETIIDLNKEKKVDRVKFKLTEEPIDSKMGIKSDKSSRPVHYDLNLFDQSIRKTDLDKVKLNALNYVVFDTETTGLNPNAGDEIISIGAVRIIDGKLHSEDTFDQLVNPKRNIPLVSLKIHEIYPEMLADKPSIEKVLPEFYNYSKNAVLVAHNAAFDLSFIQKKEETTGIRFTNPVLDTLLISSICHPNQELHNLEDICQRLGIEIIGRHTAVGDAIVTAEVLMKLIPILASKDIHTLGELKEACRQSPYAHLKF